MRAEILAVELGMKPSNSQLVDTSSYIYPRTPSSTQSPVQRVWGGDHGRNIAVARTSTGLKF
jgi:hypothetical protein